MSSKINNHRKIRTALGHTRTVAYIATIGI